MSQQDHPQPTGNQSHEAQRAEAWAAVHRPDTSSDELARIAEAHPEFSPAIAAHPNAPLAQPTAAATAPAGHAQHVAPQQPQLQAQPQFAQPQFAQPQYAQPQYAHSGYASNQYHPEHSVGVEKPRVNVAGIIAFSLLVLVTVLEFFVPLIMRQAMLTYDLSLMIGFPLVRLILALCAIAVGIVGARMHSRPRFRWMAVGSIVAGAFLAIPLLLTTLAYASPGLLPFYGY